MQGGVQRDADRFREVLSVMPAGVAVVTAIDDDEPVGFTVGSFLMVSVDPPLVGFLSWMSSTSLPRIRRSGAFCANVLAVGQEHISDAFAFRKADKFQGLSWRPAPVTGSPVLEGVAAWIDCRMTTVQEAGDHYLVLGEAFGFDVVPGQLPLVFHNRQYAGLEALKQVPA
jgi:flavin reductase (DIM6/NTAB) family NADH-FMN oxidoreductase RutF